MRNFFSVSLLAFLLAIPSLPAADTARFPVTIAFRGEYSRKARTDYATWADSISGCDVIIRKLVKDELDGIHPESAAWADRWSVKPVAAPARAALRTRKSRREGLSVWLGWFGTVMIGSFGSG